MLDYKAMKKILKASPENLNLKHFTGKFYETFCEAWRTQDWTPVFSTDFYKEEGFSYCVFLELFSASMPKWRLTFVKAENGYSCDVGRAYIYEDSEEGARAVGLELIKKYDANHLVVDKVK